MTNNTRNNLFGIIKYWAAYAVLMLHFVGIWRTYRGYLYQVETIYDRVTFFPPVIIFLAISGFLMAGSLSRSSGLKEFFTKRIKRIYIPLWISTAIYLTAYLVMARDHIDGSVFLWIVTSALGIAYTPSCLKEFATGSANGVLWTVTVLIELYILSGVMWKYIRRIPGRVWLVMVLPGLALINILSQYLSTHLLNGGLGKLLERSFIPYAVFFFLGMAAYLYQDKLRDKLLIMGAGAVVFLLVYSKLGLPDYGYYTGIVRGICTAVAAVGIGSWSPDRIGDHGLAGVFGLFSRIDFTYEMYLYQWLVLNALVEYGIYAAMEWDTVHDLVIWLTLGVSVCVWGVTQIVRVLVGRRQTDGTT